MNYDQIIALLIGLAGGRANRRFIGTKLCSVAAAGGAILLLAGGAGAQVGEGPSFDCAKAESSAEKLICGDPDLAALDRVVAERFDHALQVIRDLDTGAEAAEKELRAYQRGWVSGRDECWKSDDLRSCVEDAYLRREGELVATWLLDKPTAVVSWMCENNPANEVVTYFFDTMLPSIRIEYGDTIDTGSLTRTASGSRYDASFGRFFWEHGGEATFSPSEGQELACVKAG